MTKCSFRNNVSFLMCIKFEITITEKVILVFFFMLFDSGDGTLTAFNIRQKRMELQSELFDSELLSLSIIKVNII